VGEGHDHGAPVVHGLRWKLLVDNRCLRWRSSSDSSFLLVNGYLDVMNLPFVKDAPKI
jgi:hypothetical protein